MAVVVVEEETGGVVEEEEDKGVDDDAYPEHAVIGCRREPRAKGVDSQEQWSLGVGEVDIRHHPLEPRVSLCEKHCGVQSSKHLTHIAVRGEEKEKNERHQEEKHPLTRQFVEQPTGHNYLITRSF